MRARTQHETSATPSRIARVLERQVIGCGREFGAFVFVLTPISRLTALLAEQTKKRLRLIMYAIDNQQHTITTTETKTGTDKAAYGVRL